MKIEKKHDLLVASITITFGGRSTRIHDLVIDTGVAHSIISLDEVEGIGIAGELNDEIVYMHGIGGTEQALRKRVDLVSFAGFLLDGIHLEFWDFGSHGGINGLIGLDILEAGGFLIDLRGLEVQWTDAPSN